MSVEIIYGGEDDLFGSIKEVPKREGEGTVKKRVGGLAKDFPAYDIRTVDYWWKQAKRRKQLLILHEQVGGWVGCAVVPISQFNLEKHRVPPSCTMDSLGVRLPPQTLHIFAEPEILEAIGLGGKNGRSAKSKRSTKSPRRKTGGVRKTSGTTRKTKRRTKRPVKNNRQSTKNS